MLEEIEVADPNAEGSPESESVEAVGDLLEWLVRTERIEGFSRCESTPNKFDVELSSGHWVEIFVKYGDWQRD